MITHWQVFTAALCWPLGICWWCSARQGKEEWRVWEEFETRICGYGNGWKKMRNHEAWGFVWKILENLWWFQHIPAIQSERFGMLMDKKELSNHYLVAPFGVQVARSINLIDMDFLRCSFEVALFVLGVFVSTCTTHSVNKRAWGSLLIPIYSTFEFCSCSLSCLMYTWVDTL